jgi:Rod binding domain-containing protein
MNTSAIDGLTAGIPAGATREEAAQQLEGVFLQLLVKEMRQGMSGEGLFGGGPGASIYEGFFDQHMSEQLASGAGTGLRESILATMLADDSKRAAEPAP